MHLTACFGSVSIAVQLLRGFLSDSRMRYKDDPTILAYDIINEPRCETWRVPECPQMLQVNTPITV